MVVVETVSGKKDCFSPRMSFFSANLLVLIKSPVASMFSAGTAASGPLKFKSAANLKLLLVWTAGVAGVAGMD